MSQDYRMRLPTHLPRKSIRHVQAVALLFVVLGLFFWRPLFLGEVIYPHPNDVELGVPATVETGVIANRKFSDQSSQFIPALHHQLNGKHAGWISTWNPHVELGRATTQVSGISKAFWLTHVLSLFSSNALVVYTAIVVFAISAASIFAFLFFRAEGLTPTSSLVGALGIGIGVFTTYWATFALFIFGVTWTLAWLWLIRRMLDGRRDPLLALGIVVAVQALLLTAYPQQVIWHIWFVGIYTLHAFLRSDQGRAFRWRELAWIAGASLVGVMAAAPVYLDLAIEAGRSARVDVPVEFFTSVLPRVETLSDGLQQAMQLLDASVFGNPIDPGRAIAFNGISFTPLYAFGLAASFLGGGLRRHWPLHAFVAFALLSTFSPPVYTLGVEYLGLSLSRFIPAAGALIPIALLTAHGFDAVLRPSSRALPLAVLSASVLFAVLVATNAESSASMSGWGVTLCAITTFSVVLLAATRNSALLIAISLITVFAYAHPLLLTRPPASVHVDSSLAHQLRRLTGDGSRYAWVDQPVIPSNQESILGLRSIHSYNSLSSMQYQHWVTQISEQGTRRHGRRFPAIRGQSRLLPLDLMRAGVGVLISPARLDPALARPIGQWGPLWLHRTREDPLQFGQLTTWSSEHAGRVDFSDQEATPARPTSLTVRQTSYDDDQRVFEISKVDSPTLLWVSWQFHPHWRATANGHSLETVQVAGIFQGAQIPPGVDTVEFSFEPYVRWAWIPQCCMLVALLACLVWKRQASTSGNASRA